MRWLRWTLLGLALVVVVFVFAARYFERIALFPGAALADGEEVALGPADRRVWLDSPGARAEAFFLAATPSGQADPLVVYAHGNGELIDYWVDEFEGLRAAGLSVVLVEYPGYGRSSGTPSQGSITRTLVAAYDWAASQPQIDPSRIIGYGRSLGGGAICALARERSLAALILESTFTSIPDIAADQYGLPGLLIQNRFDNLPAVRGFPGPILLLHGETDASIPVEHARRLHAAAPGSELHMIPCGHNDCPRPWSILTDFLAEHRLL